MTRGQDTSSGKQGPLVIDFGRVPIVVKDEESAKAAARYVYDMVRAILKRKMGRLQ